MDLTAEHRRLQEYRDNLSNWKHWGPYLSERAWGTVREDYSPNGDAWDYLPHDHARSRVYRWNEDGLAGISDRDQFLCLALALWNHKDPFLKERLFGLSGPQGNHGEDVKEYYFYLDNTPTHSYMKMLYKYPQAEFPYDKLIRENSQRNFEDFEYELLDTGVFEHNRYFDVLVEYAKADENDILLRLSISNRGDQSAPLDVLPTLWFRNTWSWGYPSGPQAYVAGKPSLHEADAPPTASHAIVADHPVLGRYWLYAEGADELLFTDNETNNERLFGAPNLGRYTKDAFHSYVVDGAEHAINSDHVGTKSAARFSLSLGAGETLILRLRLSHAEQETPFDAFDDVFDARINDADAFYTATQRKQLSTEEKAIQRQALAGMLWSKQLYYFDVQQWLTGDPAMLKPPVERRQGRNREWLHLTNFDIISMPDKWEYPWYASWDLAFHCLPLALVDPDFAKRQLELVTREWYMHPNGQLPAYEWAYGDVNPPVHAWAVLNVYRMDAAQSGVADRTFLEGIFHKLLLNFTWWVNRKDMDGNNVFQGGFLGMDNISVFDRSRDLPTGGHIDQSDGTSWMAFYCLNMLEIALELARENRVYEDVATKFFEHFLRISHAMNDCGGTGVKLWDDVDGFFYDVLHMPNGSVTPLKVRSLVGLLPLFAVEILEPHIEDELPTFYRRAYWFMQNRPDFAENIASMDLHGEGHRRLLSVIEPNQLRRVLAYLLDEKEFLSPYGIRSLSKIHQRYPYQFQANGHTYTVKYLPAESDNGIFGGNSNWRGPIWFPVNYLLIESLRKYHRYYGDDFKVAFPTGSDNVLSLEQVATELSRRLIRLFTKDKQGRRAIYGGQQLMQKDPHWRNYLLFHEYFNGDDGAGLGASHQTGWTGLVANLLQECGGVG